MNFLGRATCGGIYLETDAFNSEVDRAGSCLFDELPTHCGLCGVRKTVTQCADCNVLVPLCTAAVRDASSSNQRMNFHVFHTCESVVSERYTTV